MRAIRCIAQLVPASNFAVNLIMLSTLSSSSIYYELRVDNIIRLTAKKRRWNQMFLVLAFLVLGVLCREILCLCSFRVQSLVLLLAG